MDKKIQHFKKKGYKLLTNYKKASKQQKKNYIRNAYCVFTELSFLKEEYQQISKKPKLIIGKERSGKSFLAKNISFGFSNPVFLSGRDFIKNSAFRFSAVKDNTDLIVIDDVPAKDLMEVVLECTDSIYIERQCEVGYEIKSPQIIIDCVIDRQYIGASISRRVEIIETHIEEAEDNTPIFLRNDWWQKNKCAVFHSSFICVLAKAVGRKCLIMCKYKQTFELMTNFSYTFYTVLWCRLPLTRTAWFSFRQMYHNG